MTSMTLRRFFFGLHRDEEGTSLTEFVITLPVFIIVFVAIVELWKIEVMITRVRYRAATNMWDEAMQVHSGGFLPDINRGQPALAGANAISHISGNPSFGGTTDAFAMGKNGGLAMGGSQDEADMATVFVSGAPAPPSTGSDFADKMLSDPSFPAPDPLPSASGPFAVFMPAYVASMYPATRHAIAIGTRYGLAAGENSDSVTAGGQNRSHSANYDVLVSPRSVGSMNEWIVVGFSRLTAEESPCLSSVLEISEDADFDC